MRQRRRLAVGLAVGLALVLCLLPRCSGDPSPRAPAEIEAGQVPTTDVATPTPPRAPPPRMAVHAVVDLSPAVPAGSARVTAAVGSADGGAYVVLSTPDIHAPHHLATVASTDGGYAVTGSMPLPRLRPVWDVHGLGNGTVLVSGQFRGERPGYGFLSVDPARGSVRTSVVIPFEDGTDLAHGASVLSSDGATITLFLSSFVDGRQLDLLMSADSGSGQILAGRDLSEEVWPISETGVGPWSTWLLPGPDGGVNLVFDAYPPGVGIAGIPTLVRYDRALEPVGGAVAVTAIADDARLRAAAAAPNGSVVVRAEVPDGTWLVELSPDGTSSNRLVHLAGPTDDDALVVGPALAWALVPTDYGARTVDLSTGGSTPIDVGCAPGVDQLLHGVGGVSALMVGHCGTHDAAVPTLWIAGPAA